MSCRPELTRQSPLTVILVEDSLLLRQTLAALLDELTGVELVGEAADERTAIELLQRLRPGLAIVDLELRAGSGFGILQAIYRGPERFGHPRAVVFSSHGHSIIRERCQALGIEGFFDKATQFDDLLTYIRSAAPG